LSLQLTGRGDDRMAEKQSKYEGPTLADILGENGNHLGGLYDDPVEPLARYSDSALEWLDRCNAIRIAPPNYRGLYVVDGES